MAKQANYTEYRTGKADKLEEVRTLAANDVAPDKIVARGYALGLAPEEIGKMYRAGRGELEAGYNHAK